MPAFVVARRQDGHGSLRLAITAQHVCCSYPTDVFLMFPAQKIPVQLCSSEGNWEAEGLTRASPEDLSLWKSCTCPSPPPILMLCSFPSKASQVENAFPSVQFTGDGSRPAADISSFAQGCKGERNGWITPFEDSEQAINWGSDPVRQRKWALGETRKIWSEQIQSLSETWPSGQPPRK